MMPINTTRPKNPVFANSKRFDKIQKRSIVIPGLGSHVAARVLVEEDATFAKASPYRRSTARIGQPCWLTGRIGVKCCASEYLLTLHHCTFFTRLLILKNAF